MELSPCPGIGQPPSPATPAQTIEHHDGGIVVTDETGAVVSATMRTAGHCATCGGLVLLTDAGTVGAHDWIEPEPEPAPE